MQALYVDADAGQDKVRGALLNRTKIKMRLIPNTTSPGVGVSGSERYTGDAVITSWEFSGPNDDAAVMSIEFQGSGPLTVDAVPYSDKWRVQGSRIRQDERRAETPRPPRLLQDSQAKNPAP